MLDCAHQHDDHHHGEYKSYLWGHRKRCHWPIFTLLKRKETVSTDTCSTEKSVLAVIFSGEA
jgi:hypothetical protein